MNGVEVGSQGGAADAEYQIIETCPENCSIETPEHSQQKSANYADLQNELNRLRTVLAHETMMPHLITTEPELFPDPIDQAASEHDRDIALSVKLLAIEKLRRIEQALTSLHTHSYGICSRCSHEIPYARLSIASPVLPSSSKTRRKLTLCRTSHARTLEFRSRPPSRT